MPLLLVLIHRYDLVIIIVQFDVQVVTFEQRQYLSKGIIGVRSDGSPFGRICRVSGILKHYLDIKIRYDIPGGIAFSISII